MGLTQQFIDWILPYLSIYIIPISLVSGFFGGEQALIVLSILSGQGLMSFWVLYVFFTIGILLSNMGFYFLGTLGWVDSLGKYKLFRKLAKPVSSLLKKTMEKSYFMTLLLSKLMYGTRTVTLMYFGRTRVPFLKFNLYNLIISPSILFVYAGAGWLTGRGIVNLVDGLNNVRIWISVLVVAIIVLILIRMLVHKIITQILNNNMKNTSKK